MMALALLPTQSPAQEAPPTTVEDVVVTGRKLQKAVDEFVSEVTLPPPGHGPARWGQKICVGVVNLQQDAARILIDRVSDAAASINLEPQGPDCDPNILIIATAEADTLANVLVERSPLAFRPRYSGSSQSRIALERFRTSSAPVRWWHVSLPITRDGAPAVRMPGEETAPMITGSGLLTTEITNRLLRSFIILDISKMEGLNFQQVGDYVAMVALAQMNPEADTSSFSTILNVFDEPTQHAGLTQWDRNYLQSLYGSYLNQRRPNAQVGAIGSRMARDIRSERRTSEAQETTSQD
ncbi:MULTISPECIES: hypothetical protein [unclassified Brevundimonas]|uniref:hypothetical protein n=1 Tax=unclassified Brevundimonas TaxID=2622653 RepID=UPI0025BD3A67|nr:MULTISPECIES: hypothetical protein [unclassified Brevundimonas]